MKTIIEMAREADGILLRDSEIFGLGFEFELYQLERFAALVRADEREACARFVEEGYVRQFENPWREDLAAAIRARGNT